MGMLLNVNPHPLVPSPFPFIFVYFIKTLTQGLVTVRVIRSPRTRMGPLSSPRSVMGMLSEIHKPAADAVGKIKILADRNVSITWSKRACRLVSFTSLPAPTEMNFEIVVWT